MCETHFHTIVAAILIRGHPYILSFPNPIGNDNILLFSSVGRSSLNLLQPPSDHVHTKIWFVSVHNDMTNRLKSMRIECALRSIQLQEVDWKWIETLAPEWVHAVASRKARAWQTSKPWRNGDLKHR